MHFTEVVNRNSDWLEPSLRTIIETARGWWPFRLPGTLNKPHMYSQMVTHPWTLLHLLNRKHTNRDCNWKVVYENEMTPWNQDGGQLGDLSRIYHASLWTCSALKPASLKRTLNRWNIHLGSMCIVKGSYALLRFRYLIIAAKKKKKTGNGVCNLLRIKKINESELKKIILFNK